MFFKKHISPIKSLLFVAIGLTLLSGQAFGTKVPLPNTQQQQSSCNADAQILAPDENQSQDTQTPEGTVITEEQTPTQQSFLASLAQTCTAWIESHPYIATSVALIAFITLSEKIYDTYLIHQANADLHALIKEGERLLMLDLKIPN
ncbi:MAG: hypothetical protein US69_C0013G0013 [candidate division TM6 bacterium GW2011_GWF2_38_10]|nr:MAG: hypothetical protein US69_C0013G0013 [candidate division TM6 bacterium GW2011_GWF2_38_10]